MGNYTSQMPRIHRANHRDEQYMLDLIDDCENERNEMERRHVTYNHYLIHTACRRGFLAAVARLVPLKRNIFIHLDVNFNKELELAAANGHVRVVDLLLEHPRTDPNYNSSMALRAAARRRHVDVVARLMADERTDPAACYNWALRHALTSGDAPMVDLLMADARVVANIDDRVVAAAMRSPGDRRTNLSLDRIERTDTPLVFQSNRAILAALKAGRDDIVEKLLSSPRFVVRCDPPIVKVIDAALGTAHEAAVIDAFVPQKIFGLFGDCKNKLLVKSLERESLSSLTDALMSVSLFDPNAKKDTAEWEDQVVFVAYKRGRMDVVERLLNDKRLKDYTYHMFVCNVTKCRRPRCSAEFFVRLMRHPLATSPSFDTMFFIQKAARGGFAGIVRRFLGYADADIFTTGVGADNSPGAQIEGADPIPRILDNGGIKLGWPMDKVLYTAIESQDLGLIKLILRDGRADPAARNQHALDWAATTKNERVMRTLLADPRVDAGEAFDALMYLFGKPFDPDCGWSSRYREKDDITPELNLARIMLEDDRGKVILLNHDLLKIPHRFCIAQVREWLCDFPEYLEWVAAVIDQEWNVCRDCKKANVRHLCFGVESYTDYNITRCLSYTHIHWRHLYYMRRHPYPYGAAEFTMMM